MNRGPAKTTHWEKRDNPRLLSFVVPLFQEEANIARLREKLESLGKRLGVAVEFVLVDDGSRDATCELLQVWASENPQAKVIQLSRNFGQQVALTAGIDQARGDALLLMDGDLQDPPELVEELLARYREGYDIVNALRVRRKGEGWMKRFTSVLFYWGMRTFVQKELPSGIGDFRLISGDVAESLRAMREGRRFMRGLMAWVGYRQTAVPFERQPRLGGKSNFNFVRLLLLAKDAVLSFSDFPARIGTALGIGAVATAAALSLHPTTTERAPAAALGEGWLLAAQFLAAGITLFCLGVLGEYLGRMYDELKNRPLYIVRRTINVQVRKLPRAVFPVGE